MPLTTAREFLPEADPRNEHPLPGNAPSAKLCQKNGWQSLLRSDGSTFASEQACTSYAATGGLLFPSSAGPCLPYTMKATANGDPFTSAADCLAYRAANPGALVNCTHVGSPFGDDFGLEVLANEVFCGFGEQDKVIYVREGGVFYGGGGNDIVFYVYGTYNGGAGDDRAQRIEAGTYNGGAGNDLAQSVAWTGTFNGGDGNDVILFGNGGTFNGGAGNDYAEANSGTYNGGDGDDGVGLNYATFDGGPGTADFASCQLGSVIDVELPSLAGCPGPQCSVTAGTNAFGERTATFTVQDADNGLKSIEVTQVLNATYVVDTFSLGTTDPVTVVGTQISPTDPFFLWLQLTDVNDTETSCYFQSEE